MNKIRPYLLLFAAIFFGLGISLPLMQFEKLWLFTETPSLLGLIGALWSDGEMLLSLIVFAFSILFPVVKMATLFQAAFGKGQSIGWIHALGKWSMMDVLLLAIVVFAAKTSGFAAAFTQPGLWFFFFSTLFASLASYGMKES